MMLTQPTMTCVASPSTQEIVLVNTPPVGGGTLQQSSPVTAEC